MIRDGFDRRVAVAPCRGRGSGERGSALIVAVLVTAILSLLGISFLMIAQTENRIARNEMLAAQALYTAESGARVVKRWFDAPTTALHFPTLNVIDRTQRYIIDETDPYNAAVTRVANGGTEPWYKQAVDLDGDGADDVFDRPYRVGKKHSFLGTEDHPDIRIDDTDATAAAFLDDLSVTLLAGFPDEGQGIRARISRIDVYAPPYIEVGTAWRRYGTASVKVVARVYHAPGGGAATGRVLAEREIRMVLSEIPYHGPIGPLHSCGSLTFAGPLEVRWGVMTADGSTKLSSDLNDIPRSLPREVPSVPRVDPLWNTWDPLHMIVLQNAIAGVTIEDPWLRLIAATELADAPLGVEQPYPPAASPPTSCCDHSNLVQNLPSFTCPDYDYDVWKTVATSGGRDVHYYSYVAGTDPPRFRENGTGIAQDFLSITHNAEGVYFFDTRNGLAPADTIGADGVFDNLTPAIVVPDGLWTFRGFLYLNADSFSVGNVVGASTTFRAPGEPFQDANQNGLYDAGERWIELAYPGTLGGAIPVGSMTGGSVRDDRGPAVSASAAFHGIFFTNGEFETMGGGRLYGSVVARRVTQFVDDGTAATPEIYWDASILDDFPRRGSALPRMVVTRWITQR